jgi:hypothetical protein
MSSHAPSACLLIPSQRLASTQRNLSSPPLPPTKSPTYLDAHFLGRLQDRRVWGDKDLDVIDKEPRKVAHGYGCCKGWLRMTMMMTAVGRKQIVIASLESALNNRPRVVPLTDSLPYIDVCECVK